MEAFIMRIACEGQLPLLESSTMVGMTMVGGRWNNVQKQVIDTAHGLFDPAGKSINEWGRLSCLLLVKDNCRCGFLRDGWNDSVGGRRGINP